MGCRRQHGLVSGGMFPELDEVPDEPGEPAPPETMRAVG